MIRLTATLIVCIGVTMAVAGRDLDRPEGSDQPGDLVEVTRLGSGLDTDAPGLLSDAKMLDPALIPLEDEETAIAAAIQATEAGIIPAAEAATALAVPADEVAEPVAPWFVTGNRVNLRQGPSTATSVIGQVTLGQKAQVLEETADGWYRIETSEGAQSGYIYGRYLSQTEPL
jgi:hypothetical protein